MKHVSKVTLVSLLTLLFVFAFTAIGFTQHQNYMHDHQQKAQTPENKHDMDYMMSECNQIIKNMDHMMGKKMMGSKYKGMMNMKNMMNGMQGMAMNMKHMMMNMNQMMANKEMMMDKNVDAHAKKVEENMKMMRKQMNDTMMNMEEMQKTLESKDKQKAEK